MKNKDKQIISLIKDSKSLNAGFKMLMDTYQLRLYNVIMSMIDNHHDADDILQNTFVKVYRNIQNFEGRSQLYTWIYRITVNETNTFVKKNMRKNSFFDNENKPGDGTELIKADEGTNGELAKHLLKKALKTLPPKQKRIFSLRYYDEMNYNDISEVLDTSVGALKASYYHAVKKIENYLTQQVIV